MSLIPSNERGRVLQRMAIFAAIVVPANLVGTSVTTATTTPPPIIVASDRGPGDYFGVAVASDEDHIVVGALFNDDLGESSGSAYVFDSKTGSERIKLVPIDGHSGAEFGCSVDIGGGLIVVGADAQDNNIGAAYLFDSQTLQQLAKLSPNGTQARGFGTSVAVSDSHILVGSRGDNRDAGAIYLWNRTNLSTQTRIAPSDAVFGAQFGWTAAISEATAVIGARRDNDLGQFSGSAYVYDLNTAQQLRKLTAADGATDDQFGYSVAVQGNIAVIGAPYHDANGGGSGAAYVFDIFTGAQLFKLLPGDGAPDDAFGSAVALWGNVAAIGAPQDNSSRGSVYLFDVTNGSELTKLSADSGAIGDLLGWSADLSGTQLVAGAPNFGQTPNNHGTGAVHLFTVVPEPTSMACILWGLIFVASGTTRNLNRRRQWRLLMETLPE